MDKEFHVIAITPEEFFPGEAKRITDILKSGDASMVHIRKPIADSHAVANLLEDIPKSYHKQLKLHDCFDLIADYDLAGVHLNQRNPKILYNVRSVSRSMHSFEELDESQNYDYITLSPIFNSMSKNGYKAGFDFNGLKEILKKHQNVIALGGVTPKKFPLLKELGFAGAALLGYFFPPTPKP